MGFATIRANFFFRSKTRAVARLVIRNPLLIKTNFLFTIYAMNIKKFLLGLLPKRKIFRRIGENAKPSGRYTIKEIDCTSKESRKMCDEIKRLKKLGQPYLELFDLWVEKFASKIIAFDNLVPDVYLQSLAENQVIAGGSIPADKELRFSYMAVGTSSTAPTAASTQLGTEVFRDTVDTQARSGKTARTTLIIGYSEANGNTLAEVGAFGGNASATANSGTIGSHAVLSTTIVKDVSKAVTLEIATTFSSS